MAEVEASPRPRPALGGAVAESRKVAVMVVMLAVLASSWMRLEVDGSPFGDVALIALFAASPPAALLLLAGAVPLLRRLAFLAAAALSTIAVTALLFDVPLSGLLPRDEQRFFVPLFEAVKGGVLEFYDVALPFSAQDHPAMYDAALLAVFAFSALTASCLAARRPVLAAALLALGVAWPTTIVGTESPLLGGAVVLATILLALYLVRERVDGEGLGTAATLAGTAVVALALVTSGADAVAKPGVFDVQTWDLYDAPPQAVGVGYVWDARYGGVTFPAEETVVLRVKVEEGERRALYWRATTLDAYNGYAWQEEVFLAPTAPTEGGDVDLRSQPLLPERARDSGRWVSQEVTVEALSDTRLVAASQPVWWRPQDGDYQVAPNGNLFRDQPLERGQTYTVFSYAPDVGASELATVAKSHGYAGLVERYLEIGRTPFPAWSEEGRSAKVAALFGPQGPSYLDYYSSLYAEAERVVGKALSPYAVAVALESWFRDSGGFRYEEQPRQGASGPPLVSFVLETREGYCQHYAGAMALMLRLLGVPARVAVGFTHGDYDDEAREWVVTDHDAHAWVEVYFPSHGWLPFDPTPGRGNLDAAYTVSSDNFARDAGAGALNRLLGGGGVLDDLAEREAIKAGLNRPGLEGTGPSTAPGSLALRDKGGSLLALLALVGLAAAVLVWAAKAGRRALRLLTRDPAKLALALRRDLDAYLADQGLAAPPSATPKELADHLRRSFRIDASALADALSRARYGPPKGRRAALLEARREAKRVRRLVRRSLPAHRRLRGSLSLRSLAV